MAIATFGSSRSDLYSMLGMGKSDSNIVGDVVIGSIGAVAASYGVLLAIGRSVGVEPLIILGVFIPDPLGLWGCNIEYINDQSNSVGSRTLFLMQA